MYGYHPGAQKFRSLVLGDLDRWDDEYDTFDELATAVLSAAIAEAGLAT